MKQTTKKQIAMLLVVCMLFTLLPTTALATATTTTTSAKDITLGTSAIQDPAEVTTDSGKYYTPNSYIYFGMNGTTPIKWRVLDADKTNDGTTAGMFLLSEYVLATDVQFDAGYNNNYQGSDAQTWCSNFAANSSNFSTTEQKAMLGVAKTDSTEELYNLSWDESSLTIADKAFFLSARELADYVGNYDRAPGLAVTDAAQASAWWWLRSPDADFTSNAGVIGYGGVVFNLNVGLHYGVRPALNLNLSSVLFTSAAVGGKASDGATGELTKNKNYTSITVNDGYKLTLLDESRSAFSAELKSISGSVATISYSGATTGLGEYISAIVKNGDAVKYYGRVAAVSEANGEVGITLPSGFSTANGDVLCVFNEQYNGDKNTDYASKLIDVLFDYTVNFDANGGEGTMTSRTMTAGIETELSANTFTRSGYKFIGWNTEADGKGTGYSDKQSVKNLVSNASTPSVTLIAQWQQLPASGDVTTGSSLVYNGQPQKLITTGSALNGNFVYSRTKNGDYFADIPEETDAGNYIIWYKIIGNGGYASTIPQMLEVSIAKAESSCTTLPKAVDGLTYNGTAQELIIAGTTTCGVLQYKVDDGTYSAAIPKGTEAGDYTVWYYVEGDRNHNDSEPQSIKVTIAPKQVYYGGGYYAPEIWKNPFTDVHESDWFYHAVKYAHQNKLFAGVSTTEFAPNMPMSRGMLVTVLYRLAGSPAVDGDMPFVDVNSDAYYRNAILWAVQNNIVSGIADDLFAPDTNITREQIAIILYRFAQYCGYDTSVGEDTNILSYDDFTDINEYAITAMQYAAGSGFLNGRTESTLNPQDTATRAEVAAILQRFIEGNQ